MIILVMLFSLLQQDDDDDVGDVCIQFIHICIHTVCTMFKMFNKQITAGAKPGELHAYVEKDSSEARVQCKQLIKSNIILIKN